MDIAAFTVLLCSLTNQECIARAEEYWITGYKYNFAPTILVAISIYECDMRDDVEVKIYDKHNQISRKDLCPAGLRVDYKLSKKMSGLTRLEIIDRATVKLSYFRHVTSNYIESNAYLNHYNSGFRHVKNFYGWQIRAIDKTLRKDYSPTKHVNGRTKEIIVQLKRKINHEVLVSTNVNF